jgi:hypothetical protein
MSIIGKCRSLNGRLSHGAANREKNADAYARVASRIRPEVVEGIVSTGSWLRKLASETEYMHWPIWMRVQFLGDTGGIANGIDDRIQENVKRSFADPGDYIKGPDRKGFDRTHDYEDDEYWLSIWAEILCYLLKTYYLPTDEEAMTRELDRRLKTRLTVKEDNALDAINSVYLAIKDSFALMVECGSTLIDSPNIAFNQLLTSIRTKNPTAEMIVQSIRKKISQLMSYPAVYFPKLDKKFSSEEIQDIQAKGVTGLSSEIYLLVLSLMVQETRDGITLFQLDNLTQIRQIFQNKPSSKKQPVIVDAMDQMEDEYHEDHMDSDQNKRKAKKRNLMTKENTEKITSQGREILSGVASLDIEEVKTVQEWKVTGVNARCNICGMYHLPNPSNLKNSKDECMFYKISTQKIKASNMLTHPRVIYKPTWKAVYYLSNPFKDELMNYGFPKMGIVDPEKKVELIRGLSRAIKRLGEEELKDKQEITVNAMLEFDKPKPLKSALKMNQSKKTEANEYQDSMSDDEDE